MGKRIPKSSRQFLLFLPNSWWRTVISICCLGLFGSCNTEKAQEELPNITRKYIFIGHPLRWYSRDKVDPRVEILDLKPYDQVWLGGDLAVHATKKAETVAYLDSLFHLSDSTTLWTLGNHDLMMSKLDRIRKATGRHDFYVRKGEGLTILVLNTIVQKMTCEEREKQVEMMDSVIAQIQPPEKLIVLAHYFVWGCVDDDFTPKMGNLNKRWLDFSCSKKPSTFDQYFLPKLEEAVKRGVEVICVSGDHGMVYKQFERKTAGGITFLGAGLNNSCDPEKAPPFVRNWDPDPVIIFTHQVRERKLDWEFVEINDLVDSVAGYSFPPFRGEKKAKTAPLPL